MISYDTCQPQVDVVVDCRGTDLKTTIQQNVIYDAGRVGGIVSYEASGVKVLNNTVYGGELVALYINSPSQFANHWIVKGNIFSQHQRAEISVADPASILVDEGNLLDPSTDHRMYEVRTSENQYYSLKQWQIIFNLGQASLAGEVGFTSPQEGDFHLSEDSIALNACPNTGIELDADGKPRPQDENFDCGAYEQSGGE